ncbi:hypothetical protein HDV01_001848 [Terramyces sp. JEL0728]|nr:hypothetical protein HDV01_001848 [Terramyces sp. JEL0728]
MFFGDYKRQRQINLGNSSTHSKQSLLQQNQFLRQQREEEKQRNESAAKIQNWYRNRKMNFDTVRQLRNTFSYQLTCNELRDFLMFYEKKRDREILDKYSVIIHDYLKGFSLKLHSHRLVIGNINDMQVDGIHFASDPTRLGYLLKRLVGKIYDDPTPNSLPLAVMLPFPKASTIFENLKPYYSEAKTRQLAVSLIDSNNVEQFIQVCLGKYDFNIGMDKLEIILDHYKSEPSYCVYQGTKSPFTTSFGFGNPSISYHSFSSPSFSPSFGQPATSESQKNTQDLDTLIALIELGSKLDHYSVKYITAVAHFMKLVSPDTFNFAIDEETHLGQKQIKSLSLIALSNSITKILEHNTLESYLLVVGIIDRFQNKMEVLPLVLSKWSIKAPTELPQNDREWAQLLLYNETYAFKLLTMSDEEFSAQIEKEYIKSIKELVVKLFMNQVEINMIVGMEYIRNNCSKIFNQVYARNDRKPVVDPSVWKLSDPVNPVALEQILLNVPFLIQFEERVGIFQSSFPNPDGLRGKNVEIRRGHVFEDGFKHMNVLGKGLTQRIQITFIAPDGTAEAGIDGGGLFKEFLNELIKEAFDEKLGLFKVTDQNDLYPSPSAVDELSLQYFEFLGRIMGKALQEGILVEAQFARFFLAKWLNKNSYIQDLPSLDKDIYKNLLFIKQYEKVDELGLFFTTFSNGRLVDLAPDGSNIKVTNDNKIKYIYLLTSFKLNIECRQQCQYFFKGLGDLVYPDKLSMFSESELQLLISGDQQPINLVNLRENTVYDSVFDDQHPTIVLFWQVLSEFTAQELEKFLIFCTRSITIAHCFNLCQFT